MSSIWMMTMGFLSREPPSWHDLTLHRYLGHFMAARNKVPERKLSVNSFFCTNYEILPGENLGDTTMRDSEGSADITGPDSLVSHLHNPLSHNVRKRSTVDKNSSKLIHSTVAWKMDKVKHYYAHDFPFEHSNVTMSGPSFQRMSQHSFYYSGNATLVVFPSPQQLSFLLPGLLSLIHFDLLSRSQHRAPLAAPLDTQDIPQVTGDRDGIQDDEDAINLTLSRK